MDRLQKKYKKPIFVDTSDLTLLKITLNDFLSDYLTLVKNYKKSHLITDIKNAIGLISTLISIIVLYLSLKIDFENCKHLIAALCIGYYLMNNILDIIIWLKYKEIVFIGKKNTKNKESDKGKKKSKDKSTINNIKIVNPSKELNNYMLTIYKNNQNVPIKYNRSVADLFDERGCFLYEEFLKDCENVFLGF